jgi:hypothetical protein
METGISKSKANSFPVINVTEGAVRTGAIDRSHALFKQMRERKSAKLGSVLSTKFSGSAHDLHLPLNSFQRPIWRVESSRTAC